MLLAAYIFVCASSIMPVIFSFSEKTTIIFLVLINIALYIIPLAYSLIKKSEFSALIVASPICIFLFFFTLVSIAEPLRYIILGSSYYSCMGLTDTNNIVFVMTLNLLGLVVFQSVYTIYKPKVKTDHTSSARSGIDFMIIKNISFFLLLILLVLLGVYAIFFKRLYMRYGIEQFSYGSDYLTYVTVKIGFVPTLVLFYFCNFKTTGKILTFWSIFISLIYIILQTLLGSTSSVMFVFISFMLVNVFLKKKSYLKELALISFFLASFILISRHVEKHLPGELVEEYVATIKVSDFKDILVNKILASFSSPVAITSRVVGYREILYGSTYINSIINLLLPSFFVSPHERPLTAGLWFRRMFYDDYTIIGLDFSLMAEAYLNFRIPGVIIIFGFLSLFLKRLFTHALQTTGMWNIYFYSITLIAFLWYIRSDFQSCIKILFYSIIIYLLILLTSIVAKKVIPSSFHTVAKSMSTLE